MKNKIYKLSAYLGALALGLGVTLSARADEVTNLIPTASVSALAKGYLERFVPLLFSIWPYFIGVAVVFTLIYWAFRKARHAIHGKM